MIFSSLYSIGQSNGNNTHAFGGVLRAARCVAIPILGAITLSACAAEGDFGRPKSSVWFDKLQYNVSEMTKYSRGEYSDFPLTPDEIDLREVSYHYGRMLPKAVLLDMDDAFKYPEGAKKGSPISVSTYADHITIAKHGFGPARLGEISSRINDDLTWLKKFEVLAPRVFEADRIRYQQLNARKIVYTKLDRRNTLSRMKENREIIKGVFRNMASRFTSYDYALERARIETPTADIRTSEVRLGLLRERVAQLGAKLRIHRPLHVPKEYKRGLKDPAPKKSLGTM